MTDRQAEEMLNLLHDINSKLEHTEDVGDGKGDYDTFRYSVGRSLHSIDMKLIRAGIGGLGPHDPTEILLLKISKQLEKISEKLKD